MSAVSVRRLSMACAAVLLSHTLLGCGGNTSLVQLPPGGGGTTTLQPTTTSLSVAPSGVAVTGASLALSATVSPSASGMVYFVDEPSTALGGVALQGSAAALQFSTTTLGPGKHLLDATYDGDSTHATSFSPDTPILISDAAANCGLVVADKLFNTGISATGGGSYAASTADHTAVCAVNPGTVATLTNAAVSSTAAASIRDDLYGVGSAVLVYAPDGAPAGPSLTLGNSTIASSGQAANTLTASGPGTVLTVANSAVTNTDTTGAPTNPTRSSHIGMVSRGGALNLTNDTLTTAVTETGILLFDSGGGAIDMTGGSLISLGTPILMQGSGSLTLTGVTVTGMDLIRVSADPANASATPVANIGIHGGSISFEPSIDDAMIYFNATAGQLNLTLDNVSIPSTGGELVSLGGIGGAPLVQATLTATGQKCNGLLEVYPGSTLAASFTAGSAWTGAPLGNGNTYGVFSLTLDASSTWTVTYDSALTTLNDPAGIAGTAITNIIGNGHTVTYVTSQNPALGGRTYTLAGGGTLTPAN